MPRKIVHIVGTGTIGEPLIGLLCDFKNELGRDSILMGFGLDEDAIHSPNESFGLYNFYMGIETITSFYQNFSKK